MTSTSWTFAITIGLAFSHEISLEANILSACAMLITWITGLGIIGLLAILNMFTLAPIEIQRDRSVPMQWC